MRQFAVSPFGSKERICCMNMLKGFYKSFFLMKKICKLSYFGVLYSLSGKDRKDLVLKRFRMRKMQTEKNMIRNRF